MSDDIDLSVLPEWAKDKPCASCGGQGWHGDRFAEEDDTYACLECHGRGVQHAHPEFLRDALAVALEALKIERSMTTSLKAWRRIDKIIREIRGMGREPALPEG